MMRCLGHELTHPRVPEFGDSHRIFVAQNCVTIAVHLFRNRTAL